MRKESIMSKLRRSWLQRDEEGAGALLPIIIVGVIIITVAALVNLAVTYSSNISSIQLKQAASISNNNSLLNSFQTDIYGSNLNISSGPNIKGSATVSGFGSYAVYYSTATAQPTSTSSSGVIAASTTIPSTAKWILVVTKPTTGTQQTSIFAYQPKATAVFDSAINWSGPVTLTRTSSVQNGPGVTGPVSLVARESSSANTAEQLYFSYGSTAYADVWANYTTGKTTVDQSTIRGNIVTKSAPNYIGYPKIYGNVTTSAASAPRDDAVLGTRKYSVASLPAAPGQQALRIALPTTVATLTAADCSTPALLKAKLESISSDGTVVGVNTCAATSWATTIRPKANLLLRNSVSTASLNIKDLTVGGTKNVSIQSPGGLNLSFVDYTEGAKGQFISTGAGDTVISGSNLVGAVVNYGTAGGSLKLDSSKIYYSPVASNLCTNSSTTSCTPISSTGLHLIRVS